MPLTAKIVHSMFVKSITVAVPTLATHPRMEVEYQKQSVDVQMV